MAQMPATAAAEALLNQKFELPAVSIEVSVVALDASPAAGPMASGPGANSGAAASSINGCVLILERIGRVFVASRVSAFNRVRYRYTFDTRAASSSQRRTLHAKRMNPNGNPFPLRTESAAT